MSTTVRRFMRVFGFLLLIDMLLSACATNQVAKQPTPTTVPTSVIPAKPTYKVERGDVIRTMDFTARIDSIVKEDLYFKTGGRVSKVLVRVGDMVKKGQILAELELSGSEVDLQRAQINLDIAKLRLQLTEIQTPKYKPEHDVVIALQQKEVDLAQLALDELNQNFENATIKSTIDGMVASLSVAEDTQAEAYKPIITLIDPSQLEVRAELLSGDLKLLQEGLPIQILPDSVRGQTIDGTIRRLPYPYGSASQSGNTAEKSDADTHIAVKGDLSKTAYKLGDMVKIQVILEKHKGVLWLPPRAVRMFEGRRFVVVQAVDGQHRVDVKVGLETGDRTEITEGLTEGQIVLAP